MLIDTHCHLNDSEAFPDPGESIREAQLAGVGKMIIIGVNVSDGERAIEIAQAHEGVYAAVGFHPNYTSNYKPIDLLPLGQMLKHPKVVGFGEIGLDYYRDTSPQDQQLRALMDQLELAQDFEMPVIFHCRQANDALLEVLETRTKHRQYLFHCFAGSSSDAARAVNLGAHFGVDGPVTYNSAKDLRETLRTIPLDRLVLESDSPYMPPVPHRGKQNRPAYVRFINDALASTMGVSPMECEAATTSNAELLFGI